MISNRPLTSNPDAPPATEMTPSLSPRDRTCLACGAPELTDHAKPSIGFGVELPVGACRTCGSYSWLSTLDLDAWYSGKYWDEHHRNRPRSRLFPWYDRMCHRLIAGSRYRYFKSRAPWDLDGRRYLDVGCGRGDCLRFMEHRGMICDGLEPDPDYVSLVKGSLRKGTCYAGTMETTTLPGRYDIVSASHVVEHADDPRDLVARLGAATTLQGRVYIEVPNCEHPDVLRESLEINPHTVHFTCSGLRTLCQRAGLTVDEVTVFRLRNHPQDPRMWRKLLAGPRILATGSIFGPARDRQSGEVIVAWARHLDR